MTSEVLELAGSVRALVVRHPTADPWRPGLHARDENPTLERELLALGWDDLADPELLAFAAPAAVELGRGLAPLSLVDRLLGGAATADGLARYGDAGAALVDPATLRRLRPRRLEPVGYTDAIGAVAVLSADVDGSVEQSRRDAWIGASAGYLAGLAAEALRLALEHARSREAFGRPLAAIDAVQQHLAGAATLADGALLLTEEPVSSAGLAHSAEAACRVTAACQQVAGAIGFTLEYPLQRFHRRARSVRVWAEAAL
jgi:hypothetical protein